MTTTTTTTTDPEPESKGGKKDKPAEAQAAATGASTYGILHVHLIEHGSDLPELTGPLRQAAIRVRGLSGITPADSRSPSGEHIWSRLPTGQYFLELPSVAGYTTPTRYNGFTGVTPVDNEAGQAVTISGEQKTQLFVDYRPEQDPRAARAADAQLEAAVDVTAYPLLTEAVSFAAAPAVAGGQAGGANAPLGQIAENAVRDVLNWRPRADDPSGFSLALAQSFALKDVEGHTKWTWTPRSYTVQTQMGAITGAQASLYTRAKVALDQSLPLIDGLQPLNDVFPEDLDSLRLVVRSSLTELVNEFGVLGGPRVERVDELFKLLLVDPRGSSFTAPTIDSVASGPALPTRPDQVGGQLKRVRERFGLDASRVNTVDDEQNLTNFLILVDYVIGLGQSWLALRPYFTGAHGFEPFLGTQLVLLARDLEVISELVQSTYFTLDSVLIGPAQRQTMNLNFAPNADMFLADLLDWVNRVAAEEGPRLIQGAGKDGIFAFRATIEDLERYVRRAQVRPRGEQQIGRTIPAAYATARVQRALQSLLSQLIETRRHVDQISPPILGDEEFADPDRGRTPA